MFSLRYINYQLASVRYCRRTKCSVYKCNTKKCFCGNIHDVQKNVQILNIFLDRDTAFLRLHMVSLRYILIQLKWGRTKKGYVRSYKINTLTTMELIKSLTWVSPSANKIFHSVVDCVATVMRSRNENMICWKVHNRRRVPVFDHKSRYVFYYCVKFVINNTRSGHNAKVRKCFVFEKRYFGNSTKTERIHLS